MFQQTPCQNNRKKGKARATAGSLPERQKEKAKADSADVHPERECFRIQTCPSGRGLAMRKFTMILLAALIVPLASAQSAIVTTGATGGETASPAAESQNLEPDRAFPMEPEDSRNVGSGEMLGAESHSAPALTALDGTGMDAGVGDPNTQGVPAGTQKPSGNQNPAAHHRSHLLLKVLTIFAAGAALYVGLAALAK